MERSLGPQYSGEGQSLYITHFHGAVLAPWPFCDMNDIAAWKSLGTCN